MEKRIFKRASSTFYACSLFFPRRVRRDVFDLYSFVRIADDYVDCRPAKVAEFQELKNMYSQVQTDSKFNTAKHSKDTQNERVIKNIIRLSRKYEFEKSWVLDFLSAMESDLNFKQPQNPKDALLYIHGSAEVVGLMLSRILGAKTQADHHAKMLGRSLQMINFIRDIEEDNQLGRCYFSNTDLAKFQLKNILEETARANPRAFEDFIAYQLKTFRTWLTEAEQGIEHIPLRSRIPVKLAVYKYKQTAKQIEQNPWTIYESGHKKARRDKRINFAINSLKS